MENMIPVDHMIHYQPLLQENVLISRKNPKYTMHIDSVKINTSLIMKREWTMITTPDIGHLLTKVQRWYFLQRNGMDKIF